MWQVLVFVTAGHAPSYALLPRKSHIHKLVVGNSLHLPLSGPEQEVTVTGPGMLRVSAQKRDSRGVRVYVREAGAIDEVLSLAETSEAEVVLTLPRGVHAIAIVADADVTGAITATFATQLPPARVGVPTPQNAEVPAGVPTPQITPQISEKRVGVPTPQISTPQISERVGPVDVKGRPLKGILDSGAPVFVAKPGRPLRLALAPNVAGVHLLIWRTLVQPSARIIIHGDGRLLMSAVLAATPAADHLDGEVVAAAEDLFIEPLSGTRVLLLTTDTTLGVAVAK